MKLRKRTAIHLGQEWYVRYSVVRGRAQGHLHGPRKTGSAARGLAIKDGWYRVFDVAIRRDGKFIVTIASHSNIYFHN